MFPMREMPFCVLWYHLPALLPLQASSALLPVSPAQPVPVLVFPARATSSNSWLVIALTVYFMFPDICASPVITVTSLHSPMALYFALALESLSFPPSYFIC
jgi:hypothetical protein